MADISARELLEKAIKRRSEISQEAAALDSLISMYQGLLSGQDGESLNLPSLYPAPSRRTLHAAQISEMMEAARRLIIGRGRPMKRGELVTALEEQGYTFVGKDRNKVFGTNIWRSGKFRTVGSDGYWPRDVAFPKRT